jgi:hypothetical protein
MNNENEKKFVNSKLFFWVRFVIYVLTMFLIPAAFLVIKFKLFQKITAFQIGGWGVVFFLTFGFGFIYLINQVKKGLPFCYLTQILKGLTRIFIPLLVLTGILFLLQNNIKDVLLFMYVLLPCEFVAIFVNPLPSWAYHNKLGEEGYKLKTVLKSAGLFDFFNKKDKNQ